MRIAWGTPFTEKSAIGKFSQAVTDELATRGVDVVIVRTEAGEALGEPPLRTALEVIDAADYDGSADLLIVNMGNFGPYHGGALRLYREHSPLTVFHDAELRDFEWSIVNQFGGRCPTYPFEADRAGLSRGNLVNSGSGQLLSAFAAMSCGAIIHGPHYGEVIDRACPGAVTETALCVPDTVSLDLKGPAEGPPVVVIFGVINDHKQPMRVMRALAQLKPRFGDIEFVLAGRYEPQYADRLRDLAVELGIGVPRMTGYLDDEDLGRELERAHAVVGLRYPVTEGGSGSLVTGLQFGRPLIVSNIASFAVVPDDLISKVSYGQSPDDVAEAIAAILADPKAAHERATRAKAWAARNYSAPAYVDDLLPALEPAMRVAQLQRLAKTMFAATVGPDGTPGPAALSSAAGVLTWMSAYPKGRRDKEKTK